jgi:NAD-dependent deacetylase
MDDQRHDSPSMDEQIRLLAGALQHDTRVGVLSGAGISAASGIPTFRGDDGLWKEYRAEDLATPEAFARDPETVWEWYGWRRDLIREASPNAAHFALGDLARHVGSVSIITQNVDGLHQRALQESGLSGLVEIIELHGSIWRTRCVSCSREREDLRPGPSEVPVCECGGRLRPGVVWFGEQLSNEAVSGAARIAGDCEVFLVVGTAAVVYPAASYARLAALGNALVAEINLEPTPLSDSLPVALHGPAESVLPALVERVAAARG